MKSMTAAKRIAFFLGLTFLFTYAYEILFLAKVINNGTSSATFLVSVVMLIPAICVVLTRLITGEGFKDTWIRPNFKGHIHYYLLGWLGPVALTILGCVIFFLIYPSKFDPNMGYLAETYAARGLPYSPDIARTQIIMQIAVAVIIAPIANIIFCFGEEFGRRGYLVPKLTEKFRILPVLLISGTIWGLWHAPLITLGLGYAGYPYTGILAMCGFCIVMGVLFSYVTLKTHSCLPSAIAHGTLNGFASVGLYFTYSSSGQNPFIGPAPTGILGGSGFLITMIILIILMIRDQKNGDLIAPLSKHKKLDQEDLSKTILEN
jgi:membrane protease YdiL (CAAX protease family)